MMDITNTKFVKYTSKYEDFTKMLAVPIDTPLDAEEIKGLTVFSDSAYGSAVFTDRLETGRPSVCRRSDEDFGSITESGLTPAQTQSWMNTLNKSIEQRQWLASLFTKTDDRLIQAIEIVRLPGRGERKDEIEFRFDIPQPKSEDETGVPILGQFYYYSGLNLEEESLQSAFGNFENDRHNYISTDGMFTKDTKVVFGRDVICTLGDYDASKLPFTGAEAATVDTFCSFMKRTFIDAPVQEEER